MESLWRFWCLRFKCGGFSLESRTVAEDVDTIVLGEREYSSGHSIHIDGLRHVYVLCFRNDCAERAKQVRSLL